MKTQTRGEKESINFQSLWHRAGIAMTLQTHPLQEEVVTTLQIYLLQEEVATILQTYPLQGEIAMTLQTYPLQEEVATTLQTCHLQGNGQGSQGRPKVKIYPPAEESQAHHYQIKNVHPILVAHHQQRRLRTGMIQILTSHLQGKRHRGEKHQNPTSLLQGGAQRQDEALTLTSHHPGGGRGVGMTQMKICHHLVGLASLRVQGCFLVGRQVWFLQMF